MLASTNFDKDLDLLGINGRLVVVGSRGTIPINPRSTMAKELEVYGVNLGLITDNDKREMGAFVTASLASGVLRPIVGLELSLDRASDAHSEIINRTQLNIGNIVLLPPSHNIDS